MDDLARARAATLDALTGELASRLAAYYNEEGNYAGASFLAIAPNEPAVISAADLFVRILARRSVHRRECQNGSGRGRSGGGLRGAAQV
ncbi:hypothetical protein U2F26_30010 [Micromonospora sp. 4G57]|uniref:Uncharacterized protein n=1 Tax=Micromonospora sicca TaxID=2202420 RepID=A0ABU5JLY7_9ACTN|nr:MULTISPECIES: hypothetical protein [unclassified Micromonospora]MDZ5446913.1 hypothetical protein [Micromonospora sp. 4G57]MDZ5493591.1 hypothetical protein [Micromonospora sp. 4G53]